MKVPDKIKFNNTKTEFQGMEATIVSPPDITDVANKLNEIIEYLEEQQ